MITFVCIYVWLKQGETSSALRITVFEVVPRIQVARLFHSTGAAILRFWRAFFKGLSRVAAGIFSMGNQMLVSVSSEKKSCELSAQF